MSTRAATHTATVAEQHRLSPHLTRLRLGGPGLADFRSCGIADEWVGVVVPGQFQQRYYTVRSLSTGADGVEIVIDVVVHDDGLVTEWVGRDRVGEDLTITDPRGSFAPPHDAEWVWLAGDLTALPAMARIAEESPLPVRIWAESPEVVEGYVPDAADLTWSEPDRGASRVADTVAGLEWPDTPGYFWMAGESAQMRAVRKHLMREVKLATSRYDVMGYWRAQTRQPRAVDRGVDRTVDPGPIWRAGKAAGKSDDEIWADYDRARES